MSEEDSGGSCKYYRVVINCPVHAFAPYIAECMDIVDALEMTPNEANIFGEIWRTAAARQGNKKKGHTPMRAADKIKFHADRIHQLAMYEPVAEALKQDESVEDE